MAFINPNTISNVSREEFEKLKSRVDEIDSKLNNIDKEEDFNNNLEETIINSSNEFTMDGSVYKVREDITINSATLNGIPRIEYFNFAKKEEVNKETLENSNVINLSDILNNKNDNNKSFTYKTENIPVNVKTSSGHRTTLMSENKISSLKNNYYGNVKKIAA